MTFNFLTNDIHIADERHLTFFSTNKTKDLTYLTNKDFSKKKCMQNVSTNLRTINIDPIGGIVSVL